MAPKGFRDFTSEQLLSADLEGYCAWQAVMIFADSATRSTAIGANVREGMTTYLEDSNDHWVYDGAAHVRVQTGSVDYVEVTANQSTITTEADLTSLTLTFTALANRRYRWTFSGEVTTTNADGAYVFVLTDASNNVKKRATGPLLSTSSQSVTLVYEEAPGAGSITRKMRLSKAGGTGSAGLGAALTYPAFLSVEDIGPS